MLTEDTAEKVAGLERIELQIVEFVETVAMTRGDDLDLPTTTHSCKETDAYPHTVTYTYT